MNRVIKTSPTTCYIRVSVDECTSVILSSGGARISQTGGGGGGGEGAPTPKPGEPTYFLANVFPKTIWKKLDSGAHPLQPSLPLDPLCYHWSLLGRFFHWCGQGRATPNVTYRIQRWIQDFLPWWGGGESTAYYLTNFCRQPQENVEILAQRGHALFASPRFANDFEQRFLNISKNRIVVVPQGLSPSQGKFCSLDSLIRTSFKVICI